MVSYDGDSISQLRQLKTMLGLKFLNARRDKKFIAFGLVFPLVLVGISIMFNYLITIPSSQSIQSTSPLAGAYLTYNPSSSGSEASFMSEMSQLLKVNLIEVPESEMTNLILNDTLEYQLGGYSFTTFNQSGLIFNQNVYFNQSQLIPSLNLNYFITLYKYLSGEIPNINEFTHELPSGLPPFQLFNMLGPVLIQYGYIFLVPYFVVAIVVDKAKGLRNHLFLNSLRKKVYWTANLLGDYLLYLIPAITGWILLAAFKVNGFYNNGFSFLLFVCFGLSAIPFAYILHFIFDKEETASKWVYPLTSLITTIPTLIITFAAPNGAPPIVNYILSILPSYSLFMGLSSLVKNQGHIGVTLAIQVLSCLIYIFVIYIIERSTKPPVNKIADIESRVDQVSKDDDVVAERDRVTSGAANNDMIVVNGLFKHFIDDLPDDKSGVSKKRVKPAVDGIWFGVEQSQCFGLLGHNGSGKSTTFNIMTGLLSPDAGDGFVNGKSVSSGVFSSVGSCAQNDILYDNLTLKEHLVLFANIKCLAPEKVNGDVQYFIRKFDIGEHQNKLSKNLSGGTKRKLSVACSLIGNPKVVFLDEASTGLDPSSRRKLWEIITEMKVGKAVVVISHHMEEVNAICDRVAIMSNGRLQCIGTPSHLKHKFGAGYSLDIQPSANANIDEIQLFIKNRFPHSIAMDKLGGILSFEIPTEHISLSKLFLECELAKKTLGVTEYNLSQTSLEKVFLKLALEQSENDDKDNFIIVPKKTLNSIILSLFTKGNDNDTNSNRL